MMSLKKEIERYSKLNGYPISSYQDVVCSCGGKEFNLYSDDDEGGAYAVCIRCNKEHDLANSRRYIEDPQHNICTCDNENLEIAVGKAYYEESSDPRWVYVGAHCNKCGLDGVYVDWKES